MIKTKIYFTILIILMIVRVVIAQQIIYGDQNQNNIVANKSLENNDNTDGTNDAVYYQVDEVIPNFTTGNNTLIVCRLIPGTEANIICSTSRREKGWGTMVSNDDDDAFFYDIKLRDDGANIYSIAYTDPNSGWAVGSMESNSINSGVVFHTDDGGRSWKLQFASGTGMYLHSVGLSDSHNGWVNGERTIGKTTFEIMLVTSDGGDTWTEQNLAHLNDPSNKR